MAREAEIQKGQKVLVRLKSSTSYPPILGELLVKNLKLGGFFICQGKYYKCVGLIPEDSAGDYWEVDGEPASSEEIEDENRLAVIFF